VEKGKSRGKKKENKFFFLSPPTRRTLFGSFFLLLYSSVKMNKVDEPNKPKESTRTIFQVLKKESVTFVMGRRSW